MARSKYAGTWTALITPFKNGKIDWEAVAGLVEKQIEGNVTGILVIGTTGESPTLTESEQKELISRVREMIDGRCMLMAGCGTNSTAKSVEKAREAAEAGAEVLLVVNPYYNKPTPEGLYQHFKAVAEATELPVVLYNIKGRTGVNVDTDTLVRIVEACPNVVGVKEASGDFEQMQEVIARRVREDFVVLSGDDGITCKLIAAGGDGVVSVASNIVPGRVSEMVRLGLAGESEAAAVLDEELQRMFDELFTETNPIPVKYAAHKMGLCELEYRLPMCEPSARAAGVVDEMLTNYKQI